MKVNNTILMMAGKILPGGKITGRFVVYLSLVFLFIISAIYFYWIGNSTFFYQENKSLFIFSHEYLQKYSIKPGGLLEYAGYFLTQFYYNPLYGSLIVSSLFVLISIVFIEINKRLSENRSYSLLFILLPSCLLLLLQKSPDYLMYYNLGFLLAAAWFLFSIVSQGRRTGFLSLALFPVFFYVAGSFTLIFLGMYIICTVIYKKSFSRYLLPTLIISIALITYVLFKEVLFLQPGNRLLRYPLPIINFRGLPALLYLLCGYFILFPVVIKTSGLIKISEKFKGLVLVGTALIIFPLTVFLLYWKNDPAFGNIINLERFVYAQNWDAIIEQYEGSTSKSEIGQYYYNLALSEKDQLCDRLFFGLQDYGAESLALSRDYKYLDKSVYFYYSIGLISEVHHLAVESMVINGYHPENIKLLIKTELINGNYKVAERFINVLKKTLHYRDWAEKYEKMLYNPGLINSDPELGEKIKLLPGKDFFVMFNDMQNIEYILASNPNNKRAFEYKMARLLFEKDLEAVVGEVKKMKTMGYLSMPRHIEESVMEYVYSAKKFPDLGGLSISSGTELRFKNYIEAYKLNNKGDQTLLKEKLRNEWGNTFWYYYHFK